MKSSEGNVDWVIGEWNKEKDVDLCRVGFHASEFVIDAMRHVPAAVIAKVEVKGKSKKSSDQQVWSEMRVVEAYEWTKEDSVRLAIFASELCIKNFEKVYPNDDRPRKAIEAAKYWLANQNGSAESSAASAAESARSVAWSAAWSAAESAAKSAAESARSAAWSAAWSAASAAWSARSVAESAAWSVAWSAASARSVASALKLQCSNFVLDILSKKTPKT